MFGNPPAAGGGLFGTPAPGGAPANPTAPAGPTPLFGGGATTAPASTGPFAAPATTAPAAPAQISSSTAALPAAASKPAPAPPPLSREKELKMLIAASQQNLKGYLLAADPTLLRSHVKEIVDQLKSALEKYKLMDSLLASHDIEDKIENILKQQANPLQWNDLLIDRVYKNNKSATTSAEERKKLSDQMRINLLQPVCEKLRLEPEVAFEVMQSYFCMNPGVFFLLEQYMVKIQAAETELRRCWEQQQQHPQFGGGAHAVNLQALQQRQEQYSASYLAEVAGSLSAIRKFYLTERITLLDNLAIIFQGATRKNGISELFKNMKSALLANQGGGRNSIVKALLASLTRNLKWQAEFRQLEQHATQSVLTCIQKEQIAIMELVFTLSQQQDLAAGAPAEVFFELSDVSDFFDYLVQMEFGGQRLGSCDKYHQGQLSNSISDQIKIINESKIQDLGILTFLSMLRIDAFANPKSSKEKEAMVKMLSNGAGLKGIVQSACRVQSRRPEAVSAILCIALQQVGQAIDPSATWIDERLWEDVLQTCFMDEITHLMRASCLFNAAGRSSLGESTPGIHGQYLNVLKSFLNLVYTPVLAANNMTDAMRLVQNLTMEILLKNPEILNSIWRNLDNQRANKGDGGSSDSSDLQLEMYSSILKDPCGSPSKLNDSTKLLKVLCGKNRHPHAHQVLSMLELQPSKVNPGPGESYIPSEQEFNRNRAINTNPLIKEMLTAYLGLLESLKAGRVDQEEWESVRNLTIIFSKIIKQRPEAYYSLNRWLLELEPWADDDGMSQMSRRMGQEGEADSFLTLMVEALFIFIGLSSQESYNYNNAVGEVAKHVMDAITGVFKIPHLQKSVLDLILANEQSNMIGGQPIKLNQFIIHNCERYDAQNDFKLTASYLKFMCRIFKKEIPQDILRPPYSDQVHLDESFLNEMLRDVYAKIVDSFFGWQFSSVGHFAKLFKRILKLTKILFQKFDCGNTLAKIEVKTPTPRFDMLLELISKSLNKFQLKYLIDILEPEEIRGFDQSYNNVRQSFIQNKFIARLLKESQQLNNDLADRTSRSRLSSISREKILVNDMLAESIQTLNVLLKMVIETEQHGAFRRKHEKETQASSNKDDRGVKLYYISQIPCISEMRRELIEPSAARRLPLKSNLVNLMVFYSKLEYTKQKSDQNQETYFLAHSKFNTLENNIIASEFLKLTCILWNTQNTKHRIDLSLFLVQNSFMVPSDFQKFFVIPMIVAFRQVKMARQNENNRRSMLGVLRLLIQVTEIFTVCAGSQHGFIESMFDDALGAGQVNKELAQELQDFFDVQLDQTGSEDTSSYMSILGQKIVEMLEVMTSSKVGYKFWKESLGVGKSNYESALLRNIIESLIKPICVKAGVKERQLDLNVKSKLVSEPNESRAELYGHDDEEIKAREFEEWRRLEQCQLENVRVEQENQKAIFKVYNHCSANLTLASFLKLLKNLYSVNPSNSSIQKYICEVFTSDQFNSFLEIESTEDLKQDLDKISKDLNQLNLKMQSDENLRNRDFVAKLQAVTTSSNLLSMEQAQCNQFNHELVSSGNPDEHVQSGAGSGAIYLSNLDAFRSYLGLKYQKFSNLRAIGSKSSFRSPGNIGSEFMIQTEELKYLLINNGYDESRTFCEFLAQAKSFNLCLSAMVCQLILEKAKSEFIMSVGKTKLRDSNSSTRRADGNDSVDKRRDDPLHKTNRTHSFKMLASLFPLVDQSQSVGLNESNIKSNIEKLIQSSLRIAKGLFNHLQKEEQSVGSNQENVQSIYIGQKYAEAQFEYLANILSTLNLCLSETTLKEVCRVEDLESSRAVQDFISHQLLCNLSRVYEFHMQFNQRSLQSHGHNSVLIPHQESTQPELYMELVLTSFLILEAITKSRQFDMNSAPAQTTSIVECTSKIVQIMSKLGSPGLNQRQEAINKNRQMFNNCLRILQVQTNLLSAKTLSQQMRKNLNSPLGIVISKFIDSNNQEVEDTILILQFFCFYAGTKEGALHLYNENIYHHFTRNICIQQVNNNDFYKDENNSGEQRNPYHILCCQVLLLIRTINEHVLEDADDDVDPQQYLCSLMNFVCPSAQSQSGFGARIQPLLCSQLGNSVSIVSQALLEEIELWMAIIFQLTMHSSRLSSISYFCLQGLKDCLLFGVTQLFAAMGPRHAGHTVQAVSQNEKYIQGKTVELFMHNRILREASQSRASSFSIFDLKAQIQTIKIYISYTASLMEIILQGKGMGDQTKERKLFPLDWEYLTEIQEGSPAQIQYFFSTHGDQLRHEGDRRGYGSLMKLAFDQVAASQEQLQAIYQQWSGSSSISGAAANGGQTWQESKALFARLRDSFCGDDAISKEYFGLNSVFASVLDFKNPNDDDQIQPGSNSFEAFMNLFQTALEMGHQLQKLMLEKVIECKDQARQSYGDHGGITQREINECYSRVNHGRSHVQE